MAKIYYNLIKKGLKTIDDVPEKMRAAVQALLDADPDFVLDTKTVEEYYKLVKNGDMSLYDVPAAKRDDVAIMLGV